MLPRLLKTERISLENITMEWRDEIFVANKGNVLRYFLNFADSGAVHTWINECRAQQEREERMTMVILSQEKREFLGLASVLSLNIEPQISIWIKEEAQGSGYGKEAVKSLLDWFKAEYGDDQKILYLAERDNLVSIKLASSLGMESVGDRVNKDGKVFAELQM